MALTLMYHDQAAFSVNLPGYESFADPYRDKKLRRSSVALALARPPLDTFTTWPLELGRIEERYGLTFVYPSAGKFRVRDYRKIPGGNRIELWDGIAVVYPELDRRSSSLLRYFYALLKETCPDDFVPFVGPMDLVVGCHTVFAPDLMLLPKAAGRPALVADVRRDCGSHVWRAQLRGYAHAGVSAHWAIDPDALTLTVHELEYKDRRATWRLMDETAAGA